MSNELREKIGEALQEWAQDRVDNATKLLSEQGIAFGQPLSQSIQTTALNVNGNDIEIGFTANDYYKFLDEGVKGYAPTKGRTSSGLFKYRTPYPSRKMIESIADWIPRYGIVKKMPKGRVQTIPKKEQLSVIFAYSIKKEGIQQKPFWTPTFNEEAYNDLATRIEEKLGIEINLTLTIE